MPHAHENLRAALLIPVEQRLPRFFKARRLARVSEALSWTKGESTSAKSYNVVWTSNIGGKKYTVELGKPGKETEMHTKEGEVRNPDDMHPLVRIDGRGVERDATFQDIFWQLESLRHSSPSCIELIGCLLVRSAFMLDHQLVDGVWRYLPPRDVIAEIGRDCPTLFDLPLEVFLHYIDALAWNEDVKYRSNRTWATGTGRVNTLLTCAHLAAVYLDKAAIAELAMAFARGRGIAPLPKSKLDLVFPLLKSNLISDDASPNG